MSMNSGAISTFGHC